MDGICPIVDAALDGRRGCGPRGTAGRASGRDEVERPLGRVVLVDRWLRVELAGEAGRDWARGAGDAMREG